MTEHHAGEVSRDTPGFRPGGTGSTPVTRSEPPRLQVDFNDFDRHGQLVAWYDDLDLAIGDEVIVYDGELSAEGTVTGFTGRRNALAVILVNSDTYVDD